MTRKIFWVDLACDTNVNQPLWTRLTSQEEDIWHFRGRILGQLSRGSELYNLKSSFIVKSIKSCEI